MNLKIEAYQGDPIRIGELNWPKAMMGGMFEQQERNLKTLVQSAGLGLIIDCSLVEVGNSELINLLMRIRSHARNENKKVVLFNAPETLTTVVKVCNLRNELPIAKDLMAAKELVFKKASGKRSTRIWLENHMVLSTCLAFTACAATGIVAYLIR